MAADVVAAGAAYGRSRRSPAQKINVEFISANPTGPLHLGHTRWAVVGDAIGRVLAAAGAEVTREFYINDRGVQMDQFGALARGLARSASRIPEDGYPGDYIDELATAGRRRTPRRSSTCPTDERAGRLPARPATSSSSPSSRQQLERSAPTSTSGSPSGRCTTSDAVARERSSGCASQGHVFEDDGALWMRTTDFGDDKDRVLIQSNGELTYFASDTAYYLDKRERGFDHCIYLLGADHHGYVSRLQAMAACVGRRPRRATSRC